MRSPSVDSGLDCLSADRSRRRVWLLNRPRLKRTSVCQGGHRESTRARLVVSFALASLIVWAVGCSPDTDDDSSAPLDPSGCEWAQATAEEQAQEGRLRIESCRDEQCRAAMRKVEQELQQVHRATVDYACARSLGEQCDLAQSWLARCGDDQCRALLQPGVVRSCAQAAAGGDIPDFMVVGKPASSERDNYYPVVIVLHGQEREFNVGAVCYSAAKPGQVLPPYVDIDAERLRPLLLRPSQAESLAGRYTCR